jgi:hypothetical protein
MEAGKLNNQNMISILFKILFLFINLSTGILLARSLSLSERGLGGLIFSLISILSIWQSVQHNEKLFRDKHSQSTFEINALEQLIYLGFIFTICIFADIETLFPIVFILFIISVLNSRLLAITYLRRGLILDRLLQLLHLLAFLIVIVLLNSLNLLNLRNWVMVTLLAEFLLGVLLLRLNVSDHFQFKLRFGQKSFLNSFSVQNILLNSENLNDRYMIFMASIIFSSDDLAIFVVAMSFVSIVGLPVTASYPYPVANAKKIQLQFVNSTYKKKALFIILGFVYLISCYLGIANFTHLVLGEKYLQIENVALGIVLGGAGSGMMKYFSAVWRGLGNGSLGNVMQLISLVITSLVIFSIKFILSSDISILNIFLIWALLNIFTSIILIRRIWDFAF